MKKIERKKGKWCSTVIIGSMLSCLWLNGCISDKEDISVTVPAETTAASSLAADIEVREVMTEMTLDTEDGVVTYFWYDAGQDGYDSNRTDIMSPAFYIFAENQTMDTANGLISEIGMLETVQTWAGTICVINPLDASDYSDKDAKVFLDLVDQFGPAKNVKVIGIDKGATFVNNYVSQECYFIAGMMTWGGGMAADLAYNVPVPVYISNGSETAVSYYQSANEKEALAVTETGSDSGLAEAFSNAWNKVLKKYYRIYDVETEFYISSVKVQTTPYELNEIVHFEELGIRYGTNVDAPVTGMEGVYTWYEYIPEAVLTKADGTVPLVLSCHGDGNDPHIQGDTSGWPEMAAKEGFIVVSPEWQEQEANFSGCEGLGEDGVLALIEDLKVKYPQIDASRIYMTGLSAGGAFSFKMGIKHSDMIAAIAPVSAVNIFADEITAALDDYTGAGTPLLYLCGDHDFFQMIPVDGSSPYGMSGVWESDPNVHIFSALQAYQQTLGLEVSTSPDLSLNPYYGIQLNDQEYVLLGEKQMYTGTLSNQDGVVIELAAIIDQPHWNYKAEAEYIWNFFKRYQRDMENGKFLINSGSIEERNQ